MANDDGVEGGDRVRVVVAGFLGWTLDAFDFFLVVLCSTAIAKDLGVANKDVLLASWATLAARPLGAIVFGLMADRYGRRAPLMINLVFYSIIEVATGFSNSFGMFILLRFLFGVGMGGEWGVGASLMMEKVPAKYRGVLSGVLQEGYSFGYLLAALAYGVIYPRVGNVIPGFGSWRIMFFMGGLPALLALFVRYGIQESEVWKKERAEDWGGILRTVRKQWRVLLFMVVLMALFNSASHGTQDLYPTFLKKDWGLENRPGAVSWITTVTQVGAIVGGIFVGWLSDRIGRRRAMVGAFAGAVLCIPLWVFSPSGNLGLLALGGFLMQFCVQGAWGVVPAHLTELSPEGVRGFLPGFGYQCGALIAGAVPYVQESLEGYGRARVMGGICAGVFVMAMGVVWWGGERRGKEFGGTLNVEGGTMNSEC